MTRTVCLLPSPLLGPSVWSPVAQELERGGAQTMVTPGPPAPPESPDDVIAAFLAHVPADRDVVLVPHSNAGLYLPALTGERRVVANVFVDAALPPREGPAPVTPPAMYAMLAELADEDGLLPPWTGWWDDAEVDGLFPSPQVRATVENEQPRLPLTYFREWLEVPAGWDDVPSAYLAFGDTYAEEAEHAASRGWPVHTLEGAHLHMLVDPRLVAAAIADLASSLVTPSRR